MFVPTSSVIGRQLLGGTPAHAVYRASLPIGMPMPYVPRSPRPRILSPSVTTIACTHNVTHHYGGNVRRQTLRNFYSNFSRNFWRNCNKFREKFSQDFFQRSSTKRTPKKMDKWFRNYSVMHCCMLSRLYMANAILIPHGGFHMETLWESLNPICIIFIWMPCGFPIGVITN